MKSDPVYGNPAASRSANKGRPLLAALALGGLALFAYPQEPEPQRGRRTPADPKANPTPRGLLTARPRPASPSPECLPVGEEIRTSAGQRRCVCLNDGSLLYADQHTAVKLIARRRLRLSAGEIFIQVPPDQDGTAENPLVVQAAEKQISGQGSKFGVRISPGGVGVIVTQGKVGVSGLAGLVRAGQQLAPGGVQPTAAPPVAHALAWTRDLMAAADAPLVPASKYTGGALIALDPDGQQARLSLRKYHIDVHIEDGFARTTIDQTYFNHEPWPLEGTFYFPLPPDASLSRLAMYVDGRLMEGGMAERDYARQVFETIVSRQKDPALLKWVDGHTFKMRAFPLEGRQEKRIILSYTQRLLVHYAHAEYRFPAGHSLEAVRDWSFHARLKNGAETAWTCASHPLKATPDGADLLLDAAAQNVKPDRDLVVSFADGKPPTPHEEAVRFSAVEHDAAKYLMLRYRPYLETRGERPRREWVFLFESSGDRDPLLARTQIEVIRSILANADPDDTFAVLAAGTYVRTFAPELRPVTPANIRAAVSFLEGIHLIGALDLDKALTEAGRFLRTARNQPCLVHVGGGNLALGERREDVLAKRIAGGTRYVGGGSAGAGPPAS
jgi:Ca-activated chloride channel homolog